MSNEKHSLKGSRYERMEQEVQRMLGKRRTRDGESGEGESSPQRKKGPFSQHRKTDRDRDREGKPFKAAKAAPQKKTNTNTNTHTNTHTQTTTQTKTTTHTHTKTSTSTAPAVVPAAAQGLTNERTVYIQGLPFSCEEQAVRDFFSSAGEVVSLRLPRWHDSGKLKGYGHVEFATADEAQQALELSGSYIGDRYVTVDKPMVPRALAVDPTTQASKVAEKPPGCKTIFIRNLPYETSEAEIREKFMVFGPIVKVRLAVWNHTSNLKGFGYVDFKREDSADIAVKKSGSVTIQDRVISVDYESGAPKAGYKGDKVLSANNNNNKNDFGAKKK